MRILITGTAGFIGYHLAERLLRENHEVVGLDNINDYYDVNLKFARLKNHGIERDDIEYNKFINSSSYPNYHFIKLNLEDREEITRLFKEQKFEHVCHLAAQAGVRYSLSNPHTYISSNMNGFINILEACRHDRVKHLVYASSSSVYGLNKKMPFSTSDNVDHPISLYAASKKANELMAHTYSYLFNIPTTGLRFFTVYGPWGRPDMALFKFTKAIIEDKPIEVYNYGEMERDFTYIGDIIEGVCRVIDKIPSGNNDWNSLSPDPSSGKAPYKIYNIGNHNPVKLTDFIDGIERALGKKAIKNLLPIQPGDVPKTFADVEDLARDIDYRPSTAIESGINRFVDWYKKYYEVL